MLRHVSAAGLSYQRYRAIGDFAAVLSQAEHAMNKIGAAQMESELGWCRSNAGPEPGSRYFNCDDIEEKVVSSFVPRPFTTLMIATEIPAAIRPYSIAVAADLSFRKTLSVWIMP